MRGPRGNAVVGRLPRGYARVNISGNPYYHHGHYWYRPYWYGGTVHYYPAYPPTGYYYSTLPSGHTTIVIENNTYYYSDGIYYTEAEKDGQQGYEVVEEPPSAAQPVVVEPDDSAAPDPFETLHALSDYLGKLEQFTFTANVTTDDVQESGELIQLSSRRTLSLRRPDRIVAEVQADGDDRRVTYDGKTINLLSRTHNFHGSAEMPDSIAATLDTLTQDYGMTVPLGDMLYPDVYEALVPSIRTGQYVGLHVVDERQCHHLLFSQDVIDWEIWIQADDTPLPRKLVITYKQQAHKPTFTATIPLWELHPEFAPDFFDFKPPSGSQEIQILPVALDPSEEEVTAAPAAQETR